jgi:hypothetical protein
MQIAQPKETGSNEQDVVCNPLWRYSFVHTAFLGAGAYTLAFAKNMKRLIAIFGSLVFAVALSFVFYIKGHFDGVRQASVSSLYLDTVVFDDFEKSGPDRAKSRLGMFVTSRYDALNSGASWLQSWREWLKVDTSSHYERKRVRAKEIADMYRGRLPTLSGLKAALEEDHPGMQIELKAD